MQVCIYAKRYQSDFWYQGYTLTLPAHQMAMENAKQCARVADEEGYSLELVGQWPDFLYEPLETCSATLEELNFLAQKLSQMSQEEMDTYEGVIQSVPERAIRNLPDEVYPLLSLQKVGHYVKEQGQGVLPQRDTAVATRKAGWNRMMGGSFQNR